MPIKDLLPGEAGELDITLEQGSEWIPVFQYLDSNETPIDLTSYSAKMQIRKSINDPSVIIELSTVNGKIILGGIAGTISLKITAVESAGFTLADFTDSTVYDIELIDGGGIPKKFLRGNVIFKPEVTK